ncbi:hypothetical protein CBR_g12765 [Chara braunii]|uniref:Uncharacterized protein n=1 Tax=Chara braunii TaxID=69332 RepID=A0A388KSM3_CHABU|nr:hypothetical protein CBR_g12765 [Chara braunii]|eukprot:GBG73047.1 hypothetical protein CBR_g12765 [Chara braunii]
MNPNANTNPMYMGPGGGYDTFRGGPPQPGRSPMGSGGGGGVGMGMPAGNVGGAGSSADALNDVLYGAGAGFVRSGLGAYGEKILGSGRSYVQSNISRYFTGHDVQYYFQVNDQYVRNKLKLLLFPFFHRGHWTRITEHVANGRLVYKPPRYDINAPDLYVPLMGFGTYVVLCGIAAGLDHRFTPEVLGTQFTRGLIAWGVQWVLMRGFLYALGSGEAPMLDLVAYTGYAFVGVSVSILSFVLMSWLYWIVWAWTSLCMGMFVVKTMKRILFAESRHYDRDSSRHHYILLLMAALQFPIAAWLGWLKR